jgi:hypothetical protein
LFIQRSVEQFGDWQTPLGELCRSLCSFLVAVRAAMLPALGKAIYIGSVCVCGSSEWMWVRAARAP